MRSTIEDVRGKKALLVANTGGHLSQLVRLAPRLGVSPDSTWVTFDTPQSRGLLADKNVHFVPYVAPRDWRAILGAFKQTMDLRKAHECAISTGAGLALAVLPAMRLGGKPAVFIESISRVTGPSLTGRIMANLPGIGVHAQHGWAREPWHIGPSVLATYRPELAPGREITEPKRIYVTLGTIKPYRFDRLVDMVKSHLDEHPDTEVRWQLGCTGRDDLPGQVQEEMSTPEFAEAIEWADLVVAHAGVGVAMAVLDAGKAPVLLPREPGLDEHVDGHQRQIFDYLVSRGLAFDAADVFAEPATLTAALRTAITSVDAASQPASTEVPPKTRRKALSRVIKASAPVRSLLRPVHRGVASHLPLPLRRQYLYMAAMGHPGNFARPTSFNEKVNWRIINDRRPQLVWACDKLEMKTHARELVPDESRLHIAETLWTGQSIDDIPDELLTTDGVLKPTDGSGDVVFLPATREQLAEHTSSWLEKSQSQQLGEWAYQKANHQLLLERRVPCVGSLNEYKFYCFDGEPQIVRVHTDRFTDHHATYFDMTGQRRDVQTVYIPSLSDLELPPQFEQMRQLAVELSQGWDLIRIDLFLADDGRVWFSEFTPYPCGGVSRFVPKQFDTELGSYWTLPSLGEVRG